MPNLTIEEMSCQLDLNEYLDTEANYVVIEYRKKSGGEWHRIVYGYGDYEITDFERFCRRNKDHLARPIGGGRMRADLKTRKVYVWGDHSVYGEEPDRADTMKRIKNSYEWEYNPWKHFNEPPP